MAWYVVLIMYTIYRQKTIHSVGGWGGFGFCVRTLRVQSAQRWGGMHREGAAVEEVVCAVCEFGGGGGRNGEGLD